MALRKNIEINLFEIIYKLAEWIKKEVAQQTPKIEVEESTGKAIILKIFGKTKNKQVIGGRVESGVLRTGNTVQIIRRDNKVGEGTIINIQQQKADAKEVAKANEFEAQIDSKIDIASKDGIARFIIIKNYTTHM